MADKIDVLLEPQWKTETLDKLDKEFHKAVGFGDKDFDPLKRALDQITGEKQSKLTGLARQRLEWEGKSTAGKAAHYAGRTAEAGAMAAAAPVAGFAALTTALAAPVVALRLFDAAISKFTTASSPVSMELLDQAFQDIYGVIGQSLQPVLEALIPTVQMFGDFLASVLPSQAEMQNLMDAFAPILEEVESILKELAPVIADLISLFIKGLIPVIEFVAKMLKELGLVMAQVMIWLGKQTGIGVREGEGGFRSTARGAAHKGTSFTGVEDIGKQLQLSAFSQGVSIQERIARSSERTATATERVAGAVGQPAPAFDGNQ